MSETATCTIDRRLAAVIARRWAADGYNAEVDANALVLELTAEVERIAAAARADEAQRWVARLEQLAAELEGMTYDSGTDHGYGYSDGLMDAAARLRGLTTSSEEE